LSILIIGFQSNCKNLNFKQLIYSKFVDTWRPLKITLKFGVQLIVGLIICPVPKVASCLVLKFARRWRRRAVMRSASLLFTTHASRPLEMMCVLCGVWFHFSIHFTALSFSLPCSLGVRSLICAHISRSDAATEIPRPQLESTYIHVLCLSDDESLCM